MDDGEGSGGAVSAFERFFVRVEPRLRSALTSLYGADLGREATAEAMAWSYEHWDRVREMEHPIAYLYRVGQTRTRRLRRRTPRTFAREEVVTPPEVDPRLISALAELPNRQRVAVLLVYGNDWSHGEVAALMGIAPSTVATHVARALDRLRVSLEVDARDRA